MTKFLLTIFTIFIFSLMTVQAQQQLNNAGFELWEDVGIGTDEPTHWSSVKTSDNELLNPSAPVVWGKSTDAHSGNYSLHLFNVATFGIVASGTITNGQAHAALPITDGYVFTNLEDERYHTAFNQRPDSLIGWYKCTPATGDFGTIKLALHKDYLALPGDETNLIGLAYYELPQQQVTTWTRFAVAFDYFSEETPEYFLSVITSGNGYEAILGSEVWYDDLAFIYNPSTINDTPEDFFRITQSRQHLNIQLNKTLTTPYNLLISDLMGKPIFQQHNLQDNITNINIDQFKTGIYLISIQINNQFFTQKLFLN